jgi:hypothetical protein
LVLPGCGRGTNAKSSSEPAKVKGMNTNSGDRKIAPPR